MVNENTIDNPVMDALADIRVSMEQLHNRIGYLERTGNKSDPSVSSELAQLRQSFKGIATQMDVVATANMTEEAQIAYWKQKAEERQETPGAPPREESRPVSEIPDPSSYYLRAVEPDILDAAFEEKLISSNRSESLTDEEKEMLRKLGPRKVITPTIDGFQSYKREYIRNIKKAAATEEEPQRPVGQTPRPMAAPTPGKLRPIDLATMTPTQVAANKEQLFAQMGI